MILAAVALGISPASADTPNPNGWTVTQPTQAVPQGWTVTQPTQSDGWSVSNHADQSAPAAHVDQPQSVHTAPRSVRRQAVQSRREVRQAPTYRHRAAGSLTRRVARPAGGSRSHVVQPGDTLGGLFPGSWRRIARINGISNPDLIFPGQVINY